MASVNRINEALAEVRGMPVATVEAFSRTLRRDGVLPETKRGGAATDIDVETAARMLLAVMRGSPIAAAANAIQIGGLVASSLGSSDESVLQRQLKVFGWHDGVTLADAIAWFILREVAGDLGKYGVPETLRIEVDRYAPRAQFTLQAVGNLASQSFEAWKEVVGETAARNVLRYPEGQDMGAQIFLGFLNPDWHAAKLTDARDRQSNRAAHLRIKDEIEKRKGRDVHGSESITIKTIKALAALYRGLS